MSEAIKKLNQSLIFESNITYLDLFFLCFVLTACYCLRILYSRNDFLPSGYLKRKVEEK